KARTPKDVWDEWREFSSHSYYNFKGMTYDRLRAERGLQWPCPDESHPGTVRRCGEGEDPFVTKGAGFEVYGQADKRAVVFLRPYVPSPEKATPDLPLYLTTGRVLEQWHTGTMTQRIPELAKAAGDARIEIAGSDAWKLGIKDDDRVEVKSRYGVLQGRARVLPQGRPGLLFAAFYDAKL